MCGRYTLFKLNKLLEHFSWLTGELSIAQRFNIAPTQPILAISNKHPEVLEHFHWGLIPSWAKDASIGNRMINARAESLAEKPAFRTALKRRRCLVPADGFYEWRREPDGKTKTPMYIRMKSGEPFAFAGLWDVWQSADGSMTPSCTLITTSPNELMRPIHDRMPVIVAESNYRRWLEPAEVEATAVQDILASFPAEQMEAGPVSRRVNKPAYDAPDCIESVTSESQSQGTLWSNLS